MPTLKFTATILSLVFLPLSAFADRGLEQGSAEKTEVRHAMLGFRDTLLFYSFPDQQAILVLSIDNADDTFAITGKVHLFAKATTKEALGKWINNQHSDGLFPDIPTPIKVVELPREVCRVTAHKKTGTSPNPSPARKAIYQDYEVTLSVKAHAEDGAFRLSAFTDKARVHVEKK